MTERGMDSVIVKEGSPKMYHVIESVKFKKNLIVVESKIYNQWIYWIIRNKHKKYTILWWKIVNDRDEEGN